MKNNKDSWLLICTEGHLWNLWLESMDSKVLKEGYQLSEGRGRPSEEKRRWNYPRLVDSSVVGYGFNEGMNRNRQLPALGLIYKSSELAGCISVPDLFRVSSLLSSFISLSFHQQVSLFIVIIIYFIYYLI